jgi:hypothetical protein
VCGAIVIEGKRYSSPKFTIIWLTQSTKSDLSARPLTFFLVNGSYGVHTGYIFIYIVCVGAHVCGVIVLEGKKYSSPKFTIIWLTQSTKSDLSARTLIFFSEWIKRSTYKKTDKFDSSVIIKNGLLT